MFARFFGTEKPKAPAPSLDDVSTRAQGRVGELDEKIGKLDAELAKYKQQLQKMKAGPAKKQVEQRALGVLKQKRMYEKQRDSVQGQVFNIDQAKFAQASIKDSVDMVSALRESHTAIKAQMGEFNLDDVENLHDDMEDLMADSEEMNEILGRSYAVPENIDEEDLMSELNALDDELAQEAESDEVPAYLTAAVSTSSSSAAPQRIAVSSASNVAANSSGGGSGGGLLLPSAPRQAVQVSASSAAASAPVAAPVAVRR